MTLAECEACAEPILEDSVAPTIGMLAHVEALHRQLADAREETKDLRARIEKLAGELEGSYQEDRLVARRLREVLGESK